MEALKQILESEGVELVESEQHNDIVVAKNVSTGKAFVELKDIGEMVDEFGVDELFDEIMNSKKNAQTK